MLLYINERLVIQPIRNPDITYVNILSKSKGWSDFFLFTFPVCEAYRFWCKVNSDIVPMLFR